MSDDLFRARVEPHRAPVPSEAWPEEWDDEADGVLDDLMASFDRHRVELDQRMKVEADDAPGGQAAVPSPTPTSPPADPVTARTLTAAPEDTPVPAPLPSRRVVAPQHRYRKPWLIAGAVLVVAAGAGAGIATLGSSPSAADTGAQNRPTTSPTTPAPAPATPSADLATAPALASQAADWIAANVGPGHVVACDVTVCAMLRGHGFPAASLITVQSHLSDIEQADLVAVTDVIRRQLGSSLATVTAGEPLAVFTADSATVEITPVALDGPTAYAGRLAADREARKAAGAALLHNTKITVTGAARAALAGGLVDSRVCSLLAVLGGSHAITIAAFTGTGPGAGPDLPLPGFVISKVDGVSTALNSPQATTLKNTVDAQRPPYSPLSVTRTAAGPDQGLAILFAQPGPIGLLNATTS